MSQNQTAGSQTDNSPSGSTKPASIIRNYKPSLTFSIGAYCKLLWLRDVGDTEVGFYGIARDPLRPLYIHEIRLIKQVCTSCSVQFDPIAIADYFEDMVEEGLKPYQFSRVWLHTHPGNSCTPSGDDEDTFTKSFSHQDWALMFIIAKNGDTYSRLRMNTGMGLEQLIPVLVDYKAVLPKETHEDWMAEYKLEVSKPKPTYGGNGRTLAAYDQEYLDYADYPDAPSLGWPRDRGVLATANLTEPEHRLVSLYAKSWYLQLAINACEEEAQSKNDEIELAAEFDAAGLSTKPSDVDMAHLSATHPELAESWWDFPEDFDKDQWLFDALGLEQLARLFDEESDSVMAESNELEKAVKSSNTDGRVRYLMKLGQLLFDDWVHDGRPEWFRTLQSDLNLNVWGTAESDYDRIIFWYKPDRTAGREEEAEEAEKKNDANDTQKPGDATCQSSVPVSLPSGLKTPAVLL